MTTSKRLWAALACALVLSTAQAAEEAPEPAEAPSVNARVATYIASEYRVGVGYAKTLTSAVWAAAKRYALDPWLVLAVAGKESSFRHIGNPGGGDDPRKPWGVMQVAGQWHPEKFEGGVRRTSMPENIDLGARVLADYLAQEDGDERDALKRYNGTARERYPTAVLRLRDSLRDAI